MGLKFHNEIHDPKEMENKTYTIVKGKKTQYDCHTFPITSYTVTLVWSQRFTKETMILNEKKIKSTM